VCVCVLGAPERIYPAAFIRKNYNFLIQILRLP